MRRVKLLLEVVAGAVGFVLYVWFAGVRLAPRAKRLKARRRRRRNATAAGVSAARR
jgi:hypothetical protein